MLSREGASLLVAAALLASFCDVTAYSSSEVIIFESGAPRMGRSDPDFPSVDQNNHVGNFGDAVAVSILAVFHITFVSC